MGKQSKQSKYQQVEAAPKGCCSDSPIVQFGNYVVNWQNPATSVGSLVTVNAIYWVVMPMSSTITLTAVIGSILMLVDFASYLDKLPVANVVVSKSDEQAECSCCFSKVWSSPCLTGYFPSVRSRTRLVLGLASLAGLFVSSVVGMQLSTLVYIGASILLLSKPLHLKERSEFPIVARCFDSLFALRPDASSICSTQPSSPEPVLNQSSAKKSPSLHFQVDPMEMEITSPEKPASTNEHDELAPYMPSPSAADDELLSNPESTEEISASLLPSQAHVADASLILSLRYQHDDTLADFGGRSLMEDGGDSQEGDDIEEFELVDSQSGGESESASLANAPTSSSSSSAQ